MILPIKEYCSSLFSTSRMNGGVGFVAEASTLGYSGPQRIYDDACDVGIAIRSVKTGTVVRYYLASEDALDADDTAGWRFLPIAEDERRVAACRGTTVLIIND